MPSLTTPGMYIDEVPGGQHVITAVSTDVTAFVDVFARGPLEEPVRIAGMAEFDACFGAVNPCAGPYTLEALEDFFANGGRTALVVRIGHWDLSALERALAALVAQRGFNLLCLPAVAALPDADLRQAYALALQACIHARAFLLLDMPASIRDRAAALDWLDAHRELQHANAALYFPRLQGPGASGLPDRANCGALAGIYARTDASRGVWKAPANLEIQPLGVQPALHLSAQDEATLVSGNINPLVLKDGRFLVWGARTLSPDPEWRHVPVRRLALLIMASLEQGLAWVVFESHDARLWQQVRRSVENFLMDLWRQGALAGAKAEEAFFVRCDASTMSTDDIRQGRLIVLVGFAALKPAEFQILKFTLQTSSA